MATRNREDNSAGVVLKCAQCDHKISNERDGKSSISSPFRCTHCDIFLCSACAESHKTMEATKHHQVKAFDEQEPKLPWICSKHTGLPLSHICLNCSLLICKEGLNTVHVGHASIPIEKLLSEFGSKLDAELLSTDLQIQSRPTAAGPVVEEFLTKDELEESTTATNISEKRDGNITVRKSHRPEVVTAADREVDIRDKDVKAHLDFSSSKLKVNTSPESSDDKGLISTQKKKSLDPIKETEAYNKKLVQMFIDKLSSSLIKEHEAQLLLQFLYYLMKKLGLHARRLDSWLNEKLKSESPTQQNYDEAAYTTGEGEAKRLKLSVEDRANLLKTIKAFRDDPDNSLDVVDASIRETEVKIRCVVKKGSECSEVDINKLKESLSPFVDVSLLKIFIMAEKPKFQLTNGLGSRLMNFNNLPAEQPVIQQRCSIGAFVYVQGKLEGDHILTTGHGVSERESVWLAAEANQAHQQLNAVGRVSARKVERIENMKSIDAALIKLDRPIADFVQTVVHAGETRRLSYLIQDAEVTRIVVKLCDQATILRGSITDSDYNNFENDIHGSISIDPPPGSESFHVEGESGTIVTYESGVPLLASTLYCVGMLVARVLEADGRWRSLALPIRQTLESLSEHEYVAGHQIVIASTPIE